MNLAFDIAKWAAIGFACGFAGHIIANIILEFI